MIFYPLFLSRIPKQRVANPRKKVARVSSRFDERDHAAEILCAEDFIEQFSDVMKIFIADLDEDAAAGREQFAAEQKSVAQISEITVQTQFPRVTIRLHHLR